MFNSSTVHSANKVVGQSRLDNYIYTPDELLDYSNKLFDMIASGAVKVTIHKEYAFSAEGVQQSQRDITGRATVGKLVIKIA
jgi:NADPH:quinone reductase